VCGSNATVADMPQTSADWTVAMDAHLTQRWGHGCALCARWPITWAWTRVVHDVAVGIALCARCHREDPEHEQVDAPLAARYDKGRYNT
jgi:hypothetical protein